MDKWCSDMKLWESPFKWVNKKVCICGKDSATMKVNMIFMKRRVVAEILVVASLAATTVAVGLNETFTYLWWLVAVEVFWVAVFGYRLVQTLSRGHSFKCSARRAGYSAF
jgi:hypothetical protein